MNIDLFQYYGFDLISAICALLGIYLIGNKMRFGFVVNSMAMLFGILFAVLAESIPIMVVNTLLLILNIRGYVLWKKKGFE